MNLKNVYDISFAIITEQDLKTNLGYVRSEDITDELMTSALVCATVRVDALTAGKVLTDFDKLSDEAKQKVKMACSFLAQYYLSGGYTWLRGSTSVSAGQINISQTLPDEPDYIQTWVYQLLQITNENLFKPTVSFKREFGTETYENNWLDTSDFTWLSWEQALRMFLKPWNVVSSDKSVTPKVIFNHDNEPQLDLTVNVPEIDKYSGDNTTVSIDSKNVVSARGIKDDTNFFTATDVKNALIQKADVNDLNTKADQDFKNCDLKNLIAKRSDNNLVIDTDSQKLLVLDSGSGKDFLPDGTTIKLNDDRLTISAVGLKTSSGDVISADYVKWIKNNFVNKNALNTIVSTDADNVLKISDTDKKLYVAKGQGTNYVGDEKTIHLDSNNTFSAIGVSTGDEQFPVVSGKDIVQFRDEIIKDKEQIKDLTQDVETNTKNIQTNKDGVANNKKLIDENTGSIKTLDDVVNNKCVKNDALDEIVVDKKDKPDNILQVLNGNKLYVAKPNATLVWNEFATIGDYSFEVEEGNHFRCRYNGTKKLKPFTFYSVEIDFNSLDYTLQFQFLYNQSSSISYCVYGWNYKNNKKITLLLWMDDMDFCYEKIEGDLRLFITIWELSNTTTRTKPRPILTKKNIYNANKTIFCEEDFND